MLETRNEIETFYYNLKNKPVKRLTFKLKLLRYFTNIRRKHSNNSSERITAILYTIRKKVVGEGCYGECVFRQQLNHVLSCEKQYLNLYSLLSDTKSKETLMRILKYRVTGDYKILHEDSDFTFNQYLDKTIIDMPKSDVFVDCGAFIGDTVERYITRFPIFSKIYLYEPESDNYAQAHNYLSKWEATLYHKIVFRNVGVGKKKDTLKFKANGAGSSISLDGSTDVVVVSLDEDIKEPVSFIKMDIEGFELDAIEGAKNHIINEKPILAICVYHKIDDLWEIPEYILKLNPSYKLYLRQYTEGDGNNDWETVIYAK
jgi:FkbM family methyltransferase